MERSIENWAGKIVEPRIDQVERITAHPFDGADFGGQVAAFRDQVAARFDVGAGCATPHGFLIDAPRRLAFVSCEGNALLVVLDLQAMAVTATNPVGVGPDVLAFDPDWRRLYVASESGTVSIFDERGAALQPVGEYQAPHAHTVAVNPRTHQIYLPLEDIDGKPVLRILAPMPRGEG